MNYRRLGKSGLKLSELSYGSWVTFSFQLDESAAEDCMKVAYDAGVNFFDNAEVYADGESEVIMGKVLQKMKKICKQHNLILMFQLIINYKLI